MALTFTYQTAPKGANITFAVFANGMGVAKRMSMAESEVWHKQYIKEDPEAQADWRHEWVRHFVAGYLGNPSDKVLDRILSQTRDERTREHQLAYKSATEMFRSHIVRPEKSGSFKQVKVTVDKVVELFEQLSKAEQAKFGLIASVSGITLLFTIGEA